MKNRLKLVFLSTLLAGHVGAAHAQVFSSDGQSAWSRVYQFMKNRFGSANPDDAVLLLPSAVAAAWDDPSRVVRLFEMMQWGDLEPSDSWQYHSVSSKRVSDGYSLFLDIAYNRHLASSGSIAQAAKDAIKRASDGVNAARDALNAEVKHADDAYILYLATNPHPPKTRDEYFKDQRYDKQLGPYKAKLDEAAKNLREVMGGSRMNQF